MAENKLYTIFDKLHPNMTRNEIVEVLYDLVDLKLKTNTFSKPLHEIHLVIGRDMAKKFFKNYPHNEFNTPFSVDNRIFIPEKNIQEAIREDNIGRLIRTTGHELEHVYQVHNDISDETNYNSYYYYDMPPNISNHILKNFGEEALSLINNYTYHMIANHHYYHYYHSYVELGANAMGTLYYGYSLEHYAKTVTDPDRRIWLEKQVENIFLAQEETNEDILLIEEDISKIEQPMVQIGLLSILYFADYSEEFRELILMNYDIAREFGLDDKFEEQFKNYYNTKFTSNDNELVKQNQISMREHLVTLMESYNLADSPLYNN